MTREDRIGLLARCPAARNAVLNWEDVLRSIGREVDVSSWEDRYRMDRRNWTRWVRAARNLLGLRLGFRPQQDRVSVLAMDEADVAELRAWVAALESYYCDHVHVRRTHHGRPEVEGLEDSRLAVAS